MSGGEMHKNSDGTRTQTHLTNFTGSQPNFIKDDEENIVDSGDEEGAVNDLQTSGIKHKNHSNVLTSEGDDADVGIQYIQFIYQDNVKL